MYFTDILIPLILRLAWILELHVDMSFATSYGSIRLHTWIYCHLSCILYGLQKGTGTTKEYSSLIYPIFPASFANVLNILKC